MTVAMVVCFCCKVKQSAEVPGLHKCVRCGVEFRTMWDESGGKPIEVSGEAVKHFTKRKAR